MGGPNRLFLRPRLQMKRSGFRSFDAWAGALFVAIGIAGVFFFGWGELRLAFLLLIYFLLIIGFRLDEIARQLAAIDRRLAAQRTWRPPLAPDASSPVPPDAPPPGAGGPQ